MNSRHGVTATTDMAVLPGVLGCRYLRRTVQGYVSEPIPRYRGTVARGPSHLRDLATVIHEISGLVQINRKVEVADTIAPSFSFSL
jgi:hypothetical protein